MAASVTADEIESRSKAFSASLSALGVGRPVLLVHPSIPEIALWAAIEAYAGFDRSAEVPLLLFDATRLFKTKGMLFTDRHVFFRDATPEVRPLTGITTIDLRDGHLRLDGRAVLEIGNLTLFDEAAWSVFLTNTFIKRRDVTSIDLLCEFLSRIDVQCVRDETVIDVPYAGAVLTNRRMISLYGKWALHYHDVAEVSHGCKPVSYGRASEPHPMLSFGLLLFKLIREEVVERKHGVLIGDRKNNWRSFPDYNGDDVRFTFEEIQILCGRIRAVVDRYA
jgi:hypothetical protein